MNNDPSLGWIGMLLFGALAYWLIEQEEKRNAEKEKDRSNNERPEAN